MRIRCCVAAALSFAALSSHASEDFCTKERLSTILHTASEVYRIPLPVFFGIIDQESKWNSRAVSSAGAIGLMQVMPAHADRFRLPRKSLFNPCINAQVGTYFFAEMYYRYNGDIDKALAAYNAGPRNVDRSSGIPPFRETRNYVKSVKAKTVKYAVAYGTNMPIRYQYSGIRSIEQAPAPASGTIPVTVVASNP